jgi:sterol desaturase/sphingolipid hydroxylase (fatty acid hydroxylase superfamily)
MIQLLQQFAWYAALVVAFAVLERRWPVGPVASLREQLYNFALAAVAALSTTLVLRLGDISYAIRKWIGIEAAIAPGWVPVAWWEWVLGSLAYLIVWDVVQYWYHRVQHEVRGLWPMHALHHDSEALNASDALRNTLWHHIATSIVVTLPVLVIAGSKMVHPYAAWVFLLSWGFYNHANLRWSHGPLTWLISGPQWHRLHHGKAAEYYNCNYAALFPFIDIVFGTYRSPRPDEYPETGLLDRQQSSGGLRQWALSMLGRGQPRLGVGSDE